MKIHVKKTKKMGRGVFASQDIKKGQIVEIAPTILLDSDDSDLIDYTKLRYHVYEYGPKRVCLGLGYASLYNHSDEPNCRFKTFSDHIKFTALGDISKGSELFINYGWDEENYGW